MRTTITDQRKITRVDTVVIKGYVTDKPREDVEATTDAKHIDTRKVFVYFEGEAPDWTKTRRVYGSSYSTKVSEVVDTWRPQWVIASWSKRSDQETWSHEHTKLKSRNVKKNGDVGMREEDTYIWSESDKAKMPPDVVTFIEEHAPDVRPFQLNREDVNA